MRPESRFWGKLRKVLPPGHYVRVENELGYGYPDVSFCVRGIRGIEGHIELKVGRNVKRKSTPPLTHRNGLSPEQEMWIKDRQDQGGLVIVAVQVNQKVYFFSWDALEINGKPFQNYPQGANLSNPKEVSSLFFDFIIPF